MPNVAPRGLFARNGAVWKPPAKVWARVAGSAGSAGQLLVNDPCDNFTAAPFVANGSTAVVSGGKTGNGIRVPTFSSSDLRYNIPTPSQTELLTVGFWINLSKYPSLADPVLQILTDAGANQLITLHIYEAIHAWIVDSWGPITTHIQTADNTVAPLGTWTYIELASRVHDTLGSLTLRINGVVAGSVTNVDTKSTGITKTVPDQVRFSGGGAGGATFIVDDIYIRTDLEFGTTVIPATPSGWRQADYVWAFHNGAWQVIWGRLPTAPATATATWVQPSTVRIDWTAPAINSNSQWIVRRADGSIVATVPVGTLTVTDTRPLLSSGVITNSTVAYTVEGSDGTVSSAVRATNAVTYNLTPATLTSSVAYPSATTADITLNWTPNATYGQPQGWQMYVDGVGFVGPVLPGTATTSTFVGGARGVAANWRIVPMTLNAAGAWVQAGNATPIAVPSKASDPTGVAISVPAGSFSLLRLSWNAPSGTFTGFEVETYVSSWQPLGTAGDGVRAADWTTTSTGYMRVRTLSAGGPSDWVQAGPATPITDIIGPGASRIDSWKPEASYGRMVVRGSYATDADVATGAIYYSVNSGAPVLAVGPGPVAPGQAFVHAIYTGSPGETVYVTVRTWDTLGNINDSEFTSMYILAAASVALNPTDGWTARNAVYRNDSIAGHFDLVTGLDGVGNNFALCFYGTQLTYALAGRTFVSGAIYYSRLNSQGASSAIAPGLILHTGFDASSMPNAYGPDVYGSPVARTGTVSGSCAIPATYAAALGGGGHHGLGFYRDDQNQAGQSFYMKFIQVGQIGPDGNVCGLVIINTLG